MYGGGPYLTALGLALVIAVPAIFFMDAVARTVETLRVRWMVRKLKEER